MLAGYQPSTEEKVAQKSNYTTVLRLTGKAMAAGSAKEMSVPADVDRIKKKSTFFILKIYTEIDDLFPFNKHSSTSS